MSKRGVCRNLSLQIAGVMCFSKDGSWSVQIPIHPLAAQPDAFLGGGSVVNDNVIIVLDRNIIFGWMLTVLPTSVRCASSHRTSSDEWLQIWREIIIELEKSYF